MKRTIHSGTPGYRSSHRSRLAAVAVAVTAAAMFTPIRAGAEGDGEPAVQPEAPSAGISSQAGTALDADTVSTDMLAQSLISSGMIGLGLAIGGLVIVGHRRRRW